MARSRYDDMLDEVGRLLEWMDPPAVFVGGATVCVHLDDFGAGQFRGTKDVDCVVQVDSPGAWFELEESLRERGFRNDVDGPICRWKHGDLVMDIMPMDGAVLGFSNQWYEDGVAHAEDYSLPSGRVVKVLPVELLLASKIEAYNGRGKADPEISEDLEDIISLIDGNHELVGAVHSRGGRLQAFVANWANELLTHEALNRLVIGHVPRGGSVEDRAAKVIRRLRTLAEETGAHQVAGQ